MAENYNKFKKCNIILSHFRTGICPPEVGLYLMHWSNLGCTPFTMSYRSWWESYLNCPGKIHHMNH